MAGAQTLLAVLELDWYSLDCAVATVGIYLDEEHDRHYFDLLSDNYEEEFLVARLSFVVVRDEQRHGLVPWILHKRSEVLPGQESVRYSLANSFSRPPSVFTISRTYD